MKSFFDNGVLVASAERLPGDLTRPNPLDAIQTGVMRWIQEHV